MTIDNYLKRLSGLFNAGLERKNAGLIEFEIIDYSQSGFDGIFTFGRVDQSDFIVVDLPMAAVMEAAKDLNMIEMYSDEKETVRPDWEGPEVDFSDWYGDVVCDRLASRATFLEIRSNIMGLTRALNTIRKIEEGKEIEADKFFLKVEEIEPVKTA